MSVPTNLSYEFDGAKIVQVLWREVGLELKQATVPRLELPGAARMFDSPIFSEAEHAV